MPSAPLTFRATCGSFVPVFMSFMLKRASEKTAMRVAMLTPRTRGDGVTLGLLLTYIFWGSLLLRCGDVEQNPGPNEDKTTLKQTRLSTSRLRGTKDRTGSSADSGQSTSTPQPEPSRADLMEMMQTMNATMNCKFNEMDNRFKELGEQYSSLCKDVKDLREEVGSLRKENDDLTKQNSDLWSKIDQLERKSDDLEGRSKRNNLIFYGIPRDPNERNDQSEGKIQDIITDKLDLTRNIEFERVHRLNGKPDSPIIACCSFYKDKVSVLKAKRKLKGSDVFVGEDFSSRVREIRRKLSPHLKKARSDGKRATMVFDHLIVDGEKYFLDDHDGLKEAR